MVAVRDGRTSLKCFHECLCSSKYACHLLATIAQANPLSHLHHSLLLAAPSVTALSAPLPQRADANHPGRCLWRTNAGVSSLCRNGAGGVEGHCCCLKDGSFIACKL